MKDIIDELYAAYDQTRAVEPLFAQARYGFKWIPDDGVILFPAYGHAGFLVVLMRQALPDMPLIVCDVESDKIGKDVNGFTVVDLETAVTALPEALFTICAYNDALDDLLARVHSELPISLANRLITFRQLGDILPVGDRTTKAFDVFRKTSVFTSARNRPKVKQAFELYEDPLSQNVFMAVLKRYIFASDTLVPASHNACEYFEDVYTRLNDEVVVDCGGFTGDTLLLYLRLVGDGKFKEYIVFEPDPTNYTLLRRTVDTLSEASRNKVTTLPYAVGYEEDTIHFDALANAGSVVNPEGSTEIRCVRLDDELKGKKVTLIKFDIEGYESFAIHGASEIIARDRPVLVVCVYHHPFDLYDLPLMIQRIVPDYHFFLRAYGSQYDYVCYAVPPERLKK